jgi:predicted phage baseplate assembly protein
VDNPLPAGGGRDAETLDNARDRTAIEYRTRERAVTARDNEVLAVRASEGVARARCVTAGPDDAARVYVIGGAPMPARRLTPHELEISDDVLDDVRGYLDERRPIGGSIDVVPVTVRPVTVVVHVNAAPRTSRTRVEQDLLHAFNVFINPLVGGVHGDIGDGWQWDRPLIAGELFAVVHGVSGVASVRRLLVYSTDPKTGEPLEEVDRLELGRGELFTSGEHQVHASQP